MLLKIISFTIYRNPLSVQALAAASELYSIGTDRTENIAFNNSIVVS
jgi:hypothetical protein